MKAGIPRNRESGIWFRMSLFMALLLPTAVQAASADSVNRTARSVWKVYGEAIGVVGTAFAVGPREFITSAYVAKNLYEGDGAAFISQGDRVIELKWCERSSLTYDISVCSPVERVDHYLRLSKSFDPAKEHSLHVVGYPGGSWTVLRQTGPITVRDDVFYEFPVDKPEAMDLDGVSGAPVVDSNGDVVAITTLSSHSWLYGVRSQYMETLRKKHIGAACSNINCFQESVMDEVYRLSKRGNPLAQFQIASGHGYIRQGIDLELMIRSAESGFYWAQRMLCIWYAHGKHGIEKNRAQARYWCEKKDTHGGTGTQARDVTSTPSAMMYAAKRANVRTGPSTAYRKVGLLEIGESVRVIERRGNWFRLKPRTGQPNRFVSATLLTERRPSGVMQSIARTKEEPDQAQATSPQTNNSRAPEGAEQLWGVLIYPGVPGADGSYNASGSYNIAWNAPTAKTALREGLKKCREKMGIPCMPRRYVDNLLHKQIPSAIFLFSTSSDAGSKAKLLSGVDDQWMYEIRARCVLMYDRYPQHRYRTYRAYFGNNEEEIRRKFRRLSREDVEKYVSVKIPHKLDFIACNDR